MGEMDYQDTPEYQEFLRNGVSTGSLLNDAINNNAYIPFQDSLLGKTLEYLIPGANRGLGLYEQTPYSESQYADPRFNQNVKNAPTGGGGGNAPATAPAAPQQPARPKGPARPSQIPDPKDRSRNIETPELIGPPERVGTDIETVQPAEDRMEPTIAEAPTATAGEAASGEIDAASLLPKDLGEGLDYVTQLQDLMNEFNPEKMTLPTCAHGPQNTLETLTSMAQNIGYGMAGYDPMKIRMMKEQETHTREREMQERFLKNKQWQLESKAKVLEARREVDLQKRSDALGGLQAVSNAYPDVRKSPEFLRSLGKIYKLDMNGVNALIAQSTGPDGKLTLCKTAQELKREEEKADFDRKYELALPIYHDPGLAAAAAAGIGVDKITTSQESYWTHELTTSEATLRSPQANIQQKRQALETIAKAKQELQALQAGKAENLSNTTKLYNERLTQLKTYAAHYKALWGNAGYEKEVKRVTSLYFTGKLPEEIEEIGKEHGGNKEDKYTGMTGDPTKDALACVGNPELQKRFLQMYKGQDYKTFLTTLDPTAQTLVPELDMLVIRETLPRADDAQLMIQQANKDYQESRIFQEQNKTAGKEPPKRPETATEKSLAIMRANYFRKHAGQIVKGIEQQLGGQATDQELSTILVLMNNGEVTKIEEAAARIQARRKNQAFQQSTQPYFNPNIDPRLGILNPSQPIS